MSVTVTLILDDAVGAYLERIAADQDRTPAEVAAWIVTQDLRREQAIDTDLVARLDASIVDDCPVPGEWSVSPKEGGQQERVSA